MSFQKLSYSGAFSSGADLWVVPEQKTSPWSRIIDWYLNFQMARSVSHQPKLATEGLKQVLKQNDLSLVPIQLKEGYPLMIPGLSRFPNIQTLVISGQHKDLEWLNHAQGLWEKMGRPSLRIFLPEDLSFEDVRKNWNVQDYILQIGIVESQSFPN